MIWVVDKHKFRRESVTMYLARLAEHRKITVRDVESCDHILPEGITTSMADGPQICLFGIGEMNLNDEAAAQEIRNLRRVLGKRPLVLLAAHADAGICRAARKLDVCGVLGTDVSGEFALAVLEHIRNGGTYFSDTSFGDGQPPADVSEAPDSLATPEQQAAIPDAPPVAEPASQEMPDLTGRQKEVVRLVCAGHTNKMIARELGISEATVKAHVRQVLKKLQASNRTQIVVRASKDWLATPAKPPAKDTATSPDTTPDNSPTRLIDKRSALRQAWSRGNVTSFRG